MLLFDKRSLDMGKVKDISVEKKARISAILETGNYSQREIARIEGVSRQTVQRIAYLMKENIPGTSSGRSNCGRRMKTSVREDRHIIKIATENRRLSSKGIKKILAEEGMKISERTIRRRLYGANFKCRRPVTTPRLTLKMKKKRYEWAKQFKNYTINDWRKVSQFIKLKTQKVIIKRNVQNFNSLFNFLDCV